MKDYKYKKNWGILVGTFDEDEVFEHLDDVAIEKAQEKYPDYKYINFVETRKNRKRAVRIYICQLKDLRMRL